MQCCAIIFIKTGVGTEVVKRADCKSAGLRLWVRIPPDPPPFAFKASGHATPSKHSYVKKEAILRRHTCEGVLNFGVGGQV